jgi:SAGA-associated factor 29
MASGSYLDNFLATVEDAPQDLRRNLQHMRALDTEAQDLVERIKKLAKVHVTRAKRSVAEGAEPSEELLIKIRGLHRKVDEIANEKVDMATQISDQVRICAGDAARACGHRRPAPTSGRLVATSLVGLARLTPRAHTAALTRTRVHAMTPTRTRRAQMERHLRRLNDELGKFEVELSERGALKGQPLALAGAAADGDDEDGDETGVRKRVPKRQRSSGAAAAPPPAPPPQPALPPPAKAAGRASAGGGGASAVATKKRKESLELDFDLGDLGPDPPDSSLGAELLYPDFRLPLATRDEGSRPLCGAVPAEGEAFEAGQKVAARVAKAAPGVAQELILGTVLRSAGGGKWQIGDDDDASGATVHTLAHSSLVALPLTEPPTFTRAHEHKEGTHVFAMFPDTTCFYKAKVAVAPSKRVRARAPRVSRASPCAACARGSPGGDGRALNFTSNPFLLYPAARARLPHRV